MQNLGSDDYYTRNSKLERREEKEKKNRQELSTLIEDFEQTAIFSVIKFQTRNAGF